VATSIAQAARGRTCQHLAVQGAVRQAREFAADEEGAQAAQDAANHGQVEVDTCMCMSGL